VHLKLQDPLGVVGMIDLLSDLRCLLVHAGLEKALGVVQFVLDHIRVELGELVVHISSTRIVLHIEVAVGQEGKSGTVSWRELKLVGEDSNDLDKID